MDNTRSEKRFVKRMSLNKLETVVNYSIQDNYSVSKMSDLLTPCFEYIEMVAVVVVCTVSFRLSIEV